MRFERAVLDADAGAVMEAAHPPPELWAEIEAGDVDLWRYAGAGAGYVAIERRGPVLWVHVLAGTALDDVTPRIFEAAARQGVKLVKARTRRPGIARMLARHGAAVEAAGDELEVTRVIE